MFLIFAAIAISGPIHAQTNTDSDGALGFHDSSSGHGGVFNTPLDTDGGGLPDYRDTDSDGGLEPDTDESGLALTGDNVDTDSI